MFTARQDEYENFDIAVFSTKEKAEEWVEKRNNRNKLEQNWRRYIVEEIPLDPSDDYECDW